MIQGTVVDPQVMNEIGTLADGDLGAGVLYLMIEIGTPGDDDLGAGVLHLVIMVKESLTRLEDREVKVLVWTSQRGFLQADPEVRVHQIMVEEAVVAHPVIGDLVDL